MKDHDPTKKTRYIIEWDTNSLYASVMVEELPIGEFRWASGKVLQELERSLRSGEELPSGKGASLCVDLSYPEELHDAHNDYPLAPEKVIINGVEKLAPNLGDKKEYHLTYEMFFFYLEKGLVLEKVHFAITYKAEAFLKPYIEFCAEKRREAKRNGDKFGDDFYKLAGNSVYGKTFESTRNRCNTKFVGGGERNKGVPRKVVAEKIGFEHYYDCLKNNNIYYSHFVRISSYLHEVKTDLVKKEALSAYDDKRIMLPGDPLHRTLAWFHKDAPESVKEHCDQRGPVKVVNTPLVFG